jgi:deoxyhypusine synthase
LPDAVVCYLDTTVALPLLTAYAHARHAPRTLKRLLDRRAQNMKMLRDEFAKAGGAPSEPADTDAKLPMHR